MADSALLFDPTDPATALDPFPAYARLREHGPVWHSPQSGIHFITRHADVHAAWRDKRLGSDFSQRYTPEEFIRDKADLQPWRDDRYADFKAFERWDMIALEPPDHTKLRRLVTTAFTPRSIEAQRGRRAASLATALPRHVHGAALTWCRIWPSRSPSRSSVS